jgi:hypothetical protein
MSVKETMQTIRRGPAAMLNHAVRQDNGVGFFYSPAMYRLQHILRFQNKASASYKGMSDIGLSYDYALADGGLDNKWYSYEQLEKGVITSDKVKIFFLLQAAALSDKEVAAVKKYVEAGGVVAADFRPAVFKENFAVREKGALDEVFGIKSPAENYTYAGATAELNDNSLKLPVSAGEWGLTLNDGAEAEGKITTDKKEGPAVIVNNYGNGKAMLLNFTVSGYRKFRAAGVGGEVGIDSKSATADALRPLLMKIAEDYAGLTPDVTLRDKKGKILPNLRLFTYRDKGLTYIGYVQHFGKNRVKPLIETDAVLTVKKPGHLYDVATHKYLGTAETYNIKVKQAKGELFALLPYKIGNIKSSVSQSVKRGDFVKINAEVNNAKERHIFHIQITPPDGKDYRWNSFTMSGEKGKAEDRYHVALNDLKGKWKVIITEAISGVKTESFFTVN